MTTELLQDGLVWLAGELRRCTSRRVIYRRAAGGSCLVEAVAGLRPLRIDDGLGNTRVEWEWTDWLIVSADLVINGVQIIPTTGDRIEDRRPDGSIRTYEVLPPGDESVYRVCDTDNQHWRIHTKLVRHSGVVR